MAVVLTNKIREDMMTVGTSHLIVLVYLSCVHMKLCRSQTAASLLRSVLSMCEKLIQLLSPVLTLHVVCFIVIFIYTLTSG